MHAVGNRQPLWEPLGQPWVEPDYIIMWFIVPVSTWGNETQRGCDGLLVSQRLSRSLNPAFPQTPKAC